jgi:hypothetical protein
MQARSFLPVIIAATASASISLLSLGGCGPDDTSSSASGSTRATSSGAGGNGDGGAGNDGGGGAGGALASDKCPGEAFTLKLGDSKTISQSTEGASDDLSSTCGDADLSADSPDLVYAITLEGDGSFKAKATAAAGSSLNPALYLRTDCESDASTTQCVDFGSGKAELLTGDLKAGTYYLVVDGGNKTSGAFDLVLSYAAPMCGDNVLNAGEVCEPPGLGCDQSCQFQAPPLQQDKCPGVGNTYQIPENGLTIPDHFSTGFTDDYTPQGCITPGAGGPDRVYQLVPDVAGMMTVKVGFDVDGQTSVCDQDLESPGCFDRVIYVRTTCGDAATEITCSNAGVYDPESISFPVDAFGQYYVFVDSASASEFGSFTLFVSIQM